MELNFNENNLVWQKYKPVERVYIKYYPKNNLPTHNVIVPNQIKKGVKSLSRVVYFTN